MSKFFGSIENIREFINVEHFRSVHFNFDRGDRQELIKRIENIVLQILQCLSDDAVPFFNISLRNGNEKVVDFGRQTSRRKFALMTCLLGKIYRLLTYDAIVTKRELYYENVTLLKSQREIDRSLDDICNLLQAPIWQLRIVGTAKGLIAGPITFEIDEEIVEVDAMSGTLIPQNVADITGMSSPAKWILIIEKDAAFQKMIQDGGLSRLGPVILITGKGFPDVSTRMLVRRMWETLGIPILAVVDADPYGIDIMCCYRFGSSSMALHSPDLACPAIRWLGVHPSDIRRLQIENQPLTPEEVSKLRHMLVRPYIDANPGLKNEIEIMLENRVKAEMEGVAKFSTSYLTDSYIPSKILCQEYF